MMESKKEPLIRIEHVSKTYRDGGRGRVRAVNDFSAEICRGETLGIVGESGCGKSTVGNMLVHLIEADEGHIYYEDNEITHLKEKDFAPFRRNIQMIFQDPYASMNPRKKIGWLLEETLVIHEKGLTKRERKEKTVRMMSVVGLNGSYADRYPRELSGGQRQRVSIALALMTNPAFIVADEPVSALDVSVQAQILNLMKKLQKEFSLTYLFISHDLNVVSWLSDRIGVMYLGNLVEIGSQEQVAEHPLHPYTRALFAANGKDTDGEEILQGDVPSPSDPPSGCPFHTRCPRCMEICRSKKPLLTEIEEGRKAACHLLTAHSISDR